MGIYNCASYLQEALNSLYNQTFKDFEIILCDDGSIDETLSIAKKNKEKHSNIVLLVNERNMGLNYTLNKCLSVAKGDYIARMDGDDLSLPRRLELEIEFLEKHTDFAIVSCPMMYFDENGVFRIGKSIERPQKSDFVKGSPFCHAPCMVRKEAYDKVGGYSESARLLRVEDYHLWFKMYALGYVGYNIQEPLYMMRDDLSAIKRRTFKNRLNNAYVRFIGFRMLNLKWYYYVFCLRPILIGILPNFIYKKLHRIRK